MSSTPTQTTNIFKTFINKVRAWPNGPSQAKQQRDRIEVQLELNAKQAELTALQAELRIASRFDRLNQQIYSLIQLEKQHMEDTQQGFARVLARIDAATNTLSGATAEVASKLMDLKQEVKIAISNAGMSPDQEKGIMTQFDEQATRLEAVAEALVAVGKPVEPVTPTPAEPTPAEPVTGQNP